MLTLDKYTGTTDAMNIVAKLGVDVGNIGNEWIKAHPDIDALAKSAKKVHDIDIYQATHNELSSLYPDKWQWIEKEVADKHAVDEAAEIIVNFKLALKRAARESKGK